jgi:hypothetical protein
MSVSVKVKNANYGRIRIQDRQTPINALIIPYTRGDFSLGPLTATLNETVKIRARGQRVSEALGEKVDPQVSFSAWLSDMIGDAPAPSAGTIPGALAEFLAGQGAYANVVPTSGDGDGVPKTFDLVWEVFGSKLLRGEPQMIVTMADFYGQINISEAGEGNSLAVSGEVWGDVTVERGGNTVVYSTMDPV